MNTIEYRVLDYKKLLDTYYVEKIKATGAEWVSFGSESCHRQLPPIGDLGQILDNLSGFKTKFVCPFAFESNFKKITPYVDVLVSRVDVININDMGIFYYIHKNYGDIVKSMVLGSGVSYSYMSCPWHKHLTRDEPDHIKDTLLRSNMDSEWMFSVLDKYGYDFSIELPAMDPLSESVKRIKKKGYTVEGLLKGVPVSYARACHYTRFKGIKVEECSIECNKPLTIKPTKRWDFFEADVTPIREEVKKQMPDFDVYGNVIYFDNRYPRTKFLRECDTIIVDDRMVPVDSFSDEYFKATGVRVGNTTQAASAAGIDKNSSVFERVAFVVATVLTIERDSIELSSKFIEDLGADSMSTVNIMSALEEEFNIELSEREAFNLKTIEQCCTAIDAVLKAEMETA